MGSDDQPHWTRITPNTWALVDGEGIVVRHIARRGPYLGQATPTFTVTGPDYEATEHASLDDAMAAAEESLG